MCACVARTKCFGGAARDHCARYLRGIGPRISRGWSSLWRFDIGSSGDSISRQTSVFRHDDIAQTVNSNMNLTPVARPMSYVNHAEAGERATIHTRRTTTARDRARRGDETECLVRERELKALTRARRGTRAPGRVRSAPPARPRAASPGDAARDPWRAGRRYSIRLISLQWASRDTRRTDIVGLLLLRSIKTARTPSYRKDGQCGTKPFPTHTRNFQFYCANMAPLTRAQMQRLVENAMRIVQETKCGYGLHRGC